MLSNCQQRLCIFETQEVHAACGHGQKYLYIRFRHNKVQKLLSLCQLRFRRNNIMRWHSMLRKNNKLGSSDNCAQDKTLLTQNYICKSGHKRARTSIWQWRIVSKRLLGTCVATWSREIPVVIGRFGRVNVCVCMTAITARIDSHSCRYREWNMHRSVYVCNYSQ